MEAGKPLIYPEGGEGEERDDAEEDYGTYGRHDGSALFVTGDYLIDIAGISIPNTHFCRPFRIAPM